MARIFRRADEKKSLWQRIKEIAFTDVNVIMRNGLDTDALERLEELLLGADFGAAATVRIVDRIEKLYRENRIRTESDLHQAVQSEIVGILNGEAGSNALRMAPPGELTVYLIVGVNGAGKTTSIGKLARRLQRQGHSVLLAAGDTFRAGAIDQLRIWAERTGAGFVGAKPGADPAAVAFDAVDAARNRDYDVVIVDTAGRLHTQTDLMAELQKVQRVLARKVPGAPHETLLVLDATIGQNAMSQARQFGEALELSGLILAKLDSTAKGGIIVSLKQELKLPVKLVGTGEGVDDIEAFDAAEFARGVLAE